MYQRAGSRLPQKRAKSPIASNGKPTPAKPKAGEQKMPVSDRPKARLRTSSWKSAPTLR